MTPTNPAEPLMGQHPVSPSNPASVPAVDLFSEPTFEECIEKGNRFFEELNAGKFNGWDVPEDHYVAYYAGQIHDHDTDEIALRHRVAAALGIHWARVVIHYPWMW
jgi:hypothetical protein